MSRNINHIVVEIVAPWGPAIEERPPVLSEEDRLKIRMEKRERKLDRRRNRREEGLKGQESGEQSDPRPAEVS